jgi:hypothetical protein
MPSVKQFEKWVDFKSEMENYLKLSPGRRKELVFRGQADSRWALRASLDRIHQFKSEDDRQKCLRRLIQEFKQEATGIDLKIPNMSPIAWEMLGRHHSLPTSLLDWTQSPWVAALFAFADSFPADTQYASVWMFDREIFARNLLPEIEIIEDEQMIRFNPRAIEQRGLFLQIKKATPPLEVLVDSSLIRYEIPVSERKIVLSDLDEMLINTRSLFRDLDGVAKLASGRVFILGE